MLNGPMGDVFVGSGWLGLLGAMVLGALAQPVLMAAGRRHAQGEPWAVPGAIGGALGLAAVLSALSALGSFFGFMGIAFAVIQGIGAWWAFSAPAEAARRLREQEAHAERLGAAYARGAASSSGTGATAVERGPVQPEPSGTEPAPEWYLPDEPEGDDGRPARGGAGPTR